MIPNNDPVRLLNACVEGMDLSELYQTYTRVPKNLATPKQLFKIVAYAAMNGIYSSRKIKAACRQNINYMYLLEGKPAPDNATIARFISLHLAQCSKELMAESTWLLRRNGRISSEVVFIDGTKIEANANKYTFVWKKAVSKNQARMLSKVAELIEVCEEVYGIRVAYNDRISLGTIKQLVLQLENSAVKKGSYLSAGPERGKRLSSGLSSRPGTTCRGWRITFISLMYAGTATATPRQTMTRPL